MRPFRRITPRTTIHCILIVLALFLPAQIRAQTQQAVAPWDSSVDALVSKMLPALTGAHDISLDTKNLSSLGATDVNTIQNMLESTLADRHFPTRKSGTAPGDATVAIQVTLSESAREYVWVAEISRPSTPENQSQVVILDVARPSADASHEGKAGVKLERTLIWDQQEPLLDFSIVPNGAAGPSELILLDVDRVAFYRGTATDWQLQQTATVPKAMAASRRELSGHFHLADRSLLFPAAICELDLQQSQIHDCRRQNQPADPKSSKVFNFQGSESAQMAFKCGGRNIVLSSGVGDWTQPDSIQGFVFDASPREAAPADAALDFNGPVISLQTDDAGARAIVRDLNTGHYEGFLVTATCKN